VGDDIKITVLSIKGQQIKLGLDVPEHMPVYREEICMKKCSGRMLRPWISTTTI
jgi:carbon storage regulator CsrA